MAITAAQVKELREMTGAGMMDCKKALTATEGDMDKAVEFLREKGLATAQKKASRVAAEGLCKTLVSEDGKKAVVVEVNAETDFVAKNEKFQNYVADVAAQAMNTTAADIDAFLAEAWALDTTKTVKEALAAQIAVIGENMNIRRFAQVTEENGFVASYTHMGGKIGVLVDVETDVVNDAVKEMAKNVAMQIAALKPQYTSDSEVSAEYIEHEKEILMAQIQNDPKESQKPAKVIEGMITGRFKKELKEICLLDQTYVKAEDGKQSVAKYVEQVAKENGAKITVKGFVRYETGDGIEKKEENFAEEVAKQMVWVTENGSVYHTDSSCSHINLSIQVSSPGALAWKRNQDGEKYKECEQCVGNGAAGAEVYYTKYGNRYHNSLSCKGLKRKVKLVALEQTDGLPQCSKCAKKAA